MPKKKTIKEVFKEIEEEYRKEVEERKRMRDQQRRGEKQFSIFSHDYSEDKNILVQFTISNTPQKKNTRGYIANGLEINSLYVYNDRIEIRKKYSQQQNRIFFDCIEFNDIESIKIKKYGSYENFDNFLPMIMAAYYNDYYPGIIEIILKRDVSKQGSPETKNVQNCNSESAAQNSIEFLFDIVYNDVVKTNIPKMQQCLHDYKVERKSIQKQVSSIIAAGRDIHTGDISSLKFESNDSFNTTTGDINNINYNDVIIYLSQRTQRETTGQERDEMLRTLYEVDQLIKEMQETGTISKKSKSTIGKIGDHFKKHDWFYKEIVSIIGGAVIKFIFPSIP